MTKEFIDIKNHCVLEVTQKKSQIRMEKISCKIATLVSAQNLISNSF